jgi:hypothetical protein
VGGNGAVKAPVDSHSDALKQASARLLLRASRLLEAAKVLGLDTSEYGDLAFQAEIINQHFNGGSSGATSL